MDNQFTRTELLIGKNGIEKLKNSKVIIFGIGGVGGYAAEALARSAVGRIDLVDNDIISLSNINRQIIALHSTIGRYKAEAAKERLLDINPNLKIDVYKIFYSRETGDVFDFSKYDYVIDAIDTVSAKLDLIEQCNKIKTPIISSMGAGNKINPDMFEAEDIYKTSVCPLARIMRYELKKRNIPKLKTVYSKEKPIKPKKSNTMDKFPPSSIAFTPAAAGLIIAGEVVKDLINF